MGWALIAGIVCLLAGEALGSAAVLPKSTALVSRERRLAKATGASLASHWRWALSFLALGVLLGLTLDMPVLVVAIFTAVAATFFVGQVDPPPRDRRARISAVASWLAIFGMCLAALSLGQLVL